MSLALAFGIVTIACWAILAIVVSRFRPPRPLWPVVFWLSLSGFLWSVGELGTSFLARTAEEHWIWLIVLYTGVLANVPLWWSLSLRVARTHRSSPRWATRAVELAPGAVGLVCWLGLLTNPWLGWFIEPRWEGRNEYRVLWYVQAVSSYLVLAAALALFRWVRRQKEPSSRARVQLDTLSIAAAIPFLFNALYVSRVVSPGFDPTLLAFGLALGVVFTGMWRNQLFGFSSLTLEHWIAHEPDGVALVDPKGQLGRANEATARLLGVEALSPGVSFLDVLRERLVEEGDSLDDLFIGKELPEGYSFETRAAPRRWLRVRVTPIPRRWPGPGGFGLRFHDETRLRDAQEAAAQQAASIEALLGSIQDGLFVLDEKGRLLYANERFWEMWEIPDPGSRGSSKVETELFMVLSTKLSNPGTLAEARDRALVTGAVVEAVELVSLDARTFSLTSVPLVSETNLAGRVWTFRDVTEGKRAEEHRRQLEERMRDSQKLESLGVLAGGIAHDFNNILVGVLGNAELALARAEPDSPSFALISSIKRSADRAAELVQQLLTYAGQGRIGIERFDLSSLVEETRELIGSAISKKAEVVMDLEPKVYVEGDSVRLRQIVMNMITNASDALGDDPGTVTIRSGKRPIEAGELEDALPRREPYGRDYAFVSISDTGCGMDANTLSRIFEPFFSTKFAGRGLGLSSALGIVRSHDGFIKVRSSPGQGTAFDVFLPVVSAPRPTRQEGGAKISDLSTHGGTVLVVDDEETVRSVARSTLELQGYRVLVADDGHEGVEIFRHHEEEIEVIVLDMTMPRMDGAEALFAIRQISRDVPVVLTSGYSEQDTMNRCAGLAAVAFIQKPFTAFELMSKVREASRRRVEAGARK